MSLQVRGGAETGVSLARQVANGSVRSTPNATPGGSRGGGFAYMPASPSHYAGGGSGGGGFNNSQGPAPGGGGGGFRPPVNRGGGGFSGASNGAVAQFNLVGKAVTVTGGQYRGYKGRVKHETATHVQLEMDAISGRIVTIKKELIGGAAAGAKGPGAAGGRGPGGPGQRIPHPSVQERGGNAYGTRTPLHPSQTPLHPSMTPAHYSMTPSHAPYTPAHAPTPSDDNYYMLGGHHVSVASHVQHATLWGLQQAAGCLQVPSKIAHGYACPCCSSLLNLTIPDVCQLALPCTQASLRFDILH